MKYNQIHHVGGGPCVRPSQKGETMNYETILRPSSRFTIYIHGILLIISWVIIGILLQNTQDNTTPEEIAEIHAIKYIIPNSPLNMPMQHASSTIPPDSGLLWLINQDNPLLPDFIPPNLVTHHGIHLQATAHTAYNQMLAAMQADGIHGLQLASAYRPYTHQRNLFTAKTSVYTAQGYSQIEAEEIASETVQPPGASEHQLGLALDVTITGDLTQAFADTSAGQWLAANSHRFGFIIRYPQAKTEITHIIYEPWHLRFVGIPHSVIMYENSLTLEEYANFIATVGTYIVWSGTNEYYLVIFSDTLPEAVPHGIIDISSTHPGAEASYILTFRRSGA